MQLYANVYNRTYFERLSEHALAEAQRGELRKIASVGRALTSSERLKFAFAISDDPAMEKMAFGLLGRMAGGGLRRGFQGMNALSRGAGRVINDIGAETAAIDRGIAAIPGQARNAVGAVGNAVDRAGRMNRIEFQRGLAGRAPVAGRQFLSGKGRVPSTPAEAASGSMMRNSQIPQTSSGAGAVQPPGGAPGGGTVNPSTSMALVPTSRGFQSGAGGYVPGGPGPVLDVATRPAIGVPATIPGASQANWRSRLGNALQGMGPFGQWADKNLGVIGGAAGGAGVVQGANSYADYKRREAIRNMGFGDRLGAALGLLVNPGSIADRF